MAPSTTANPETPIAKPAVVAHKKRFTNPLVSSTEYRDYDIRYVDGLRERVQNEVNLQLDKGSAKVISVYYRDLTNDDLFGINESELFSPASLLKVPLMITILKYAESNASILQQTVEYNQPVELLHKKNPEGITANSVLITGRSYTIDQLLEIMIEVSDNEATILLLQYIDNVAPGFRQTVEKDLKMIAPAQANHLDDYVSVKRYSSFFRTLFNASYLSEEMSNKALNILSRTGFGNGIRQAVPKQIVVCQKYGHRQLDKDHHQYHHFAIVYHPKKPFLLGVMTKGASPEKLQSAIAAIAGKIYQEVDAKANEQASYLSRDVD